jgi:hypothetical protein
VSGNLFTGFVLCFFMVEDVLLEKLTLLGVVTVPAG